MATEYKTIVINHNTGKTIKVDANCLYLSSNSRDCAYMYNCCSCGGVDCGCAYCFDCNACEHCKNENN